MRIIVIAIATFLCMKLPAQSIECRLFIEPTSSTLISDMEIITTPIHDYEIETLSKLSYGSEFIRITKGNWGYGVRFSYWTNAKFISFDYRMPSQINPDSWIWKNSSRIYKIKHFSSNLILNKTINRYKMSLGVGIVSTDNSRKKRYQIDVYSQGSEFIGSGEYSYKVGGVKVQNIGRSWDGLYIVNSFRFEYAVSNNIHMGVSVNYTPKTDVFVQLRSWEVESFDLENQGNIFSDLSGSDKTNDTAEIWVKEDKLKLGFSIGYQFSKKLKQKRKKRRKSEKEQTIKQ